jgi:predicted TIM-barrel fold metal-dependent hydrolase
MQRSDVNWEESLQEEVLEPDLPIVDSHHHLWPPGYRIPYDLAALESDLGRGHCVEATVFVECMTSFRPEGTDDALRPLGETEFVVAAAPAAKMASGPTVGAAVVDWADLLAGSADVARTLDGHLEVGQVYGFGFQNGPRPTWRELAEVWKPRADVAVETFGPKRCMFESNFPVDKQSFSYDALWNAFKLLTTDFSERERLLVFAGTARRVYGLD